MNRAHLGKGVSYTGYSYKVTTHNDTSHIVTSRTTTRVVDTKTNPRSHNAQQPCSVSQLNSTRSIKVWATLCLLALMTVFGSLRAYALDVAIQTPSNPTNRMAQDENFYITVGNPNSTPVTNVTLVFVTPDNAVINQTDIDTGAADHTVTCSGGCGTGKVVTIDLKTLAAGETVRLSINFLTIVLPIGATPDPLTIDISARVDGNEVTRATAALAFTETPDVQVALDASAGPVAPGDTITYTVTYAQRDAAPLQTSSLKLQLPIGLSFVSATNNPTVSGQLVEWDTGTFESETIGVQQVIAQVSATGLTNGTLLTADASFGGQDSGLDIKEASVNRTVYVDDSPRPGLAFSLEAPQVIRSDAARTRITVSNPSTDALSNVELYFRHPGALSQPVLFPDPGGRVNKISCPGGVCAANQLVVYELKRIAPGASTTIDYMPMRSFSAFADGELVPVDVTVRVDGVQRSSASDTYAVTPENYFNLVVDTTDSPLRTESIVTYEIDYANVTDLAYTNSTLILPIPSNLTFANATGNPTQVTGVTGNELHWDLGILAGHETGRQTVKLNIPSGTFRNGDLIKVEAAIRGQDPGFEFRELRAMDVSPISNRSRPDITFNYPQQNLSYNDPLTVSVTVSNPTDQILNDINVVMRSPKGVSLASAVDTGGDANTATCTFSNCREGGLFDIDLNALPPGDGVTYDLSFRSNTFSVPLTSLMPFHADVRVAGLQRAFASDNVRFRDSAFFTISVETPSGPVNTGVQLKYTVKYGNVSALTSNNTQIRFPVPDGMDFVSANAGGVYDGSAVIWNPGSITGGETYAVEAILQANGGEITEGTILSDVVTITGTDTGFNRRTISKRWHNRVNNTVKPSLEIIPADDPAVPGKSTQIDINVGNTSTTTLRNVALVMRYPEHLTSVRASDIDAGGTANVVTCPAGTCAPGRLMTVDLTTIPAGRSVRIRIPVRSVSSSLADGSLIPIYANVRVNGRQTTLANTTIRVDRAPTPVVGGGAIELVVDQVDRTKYGWKYGTSNHGQSVPFRFEGIGEDLLLSLRGFDIDDLDEVSVLLNGVEVGNLIRSGNNKLSGFNRIVLPVARQVSGTNFLEFKQKTPGFKYGITTIKIRPVAGPVIPLVLGTKDQNPYGYRFSGTSTHPGIVPMTFTGGTQDLFLSLVGFDIDDSDEVSVWLNGSQLGSVKKGRNNQIAPVTRIFVPLSGQVSGTNRLEFRQQKVGNVYGVKNVFLRAALGPVVPLIPGVKDTDSYGYRFFKSSGHATRLQATFGRINDDVRISLRAYDIDTADEVSVFLNGAFLGNLLVSGNLKEKTTVFEVPEANILDSNLLEFRQLVPGNRWGIRNLLVRPTP